MDTGQLTEYGRGLATLTFLKCYNGHGSSAGVEMAGGLSGGLTRKGDWKGESEKTR